MRMCGSGPVACRHMVAVVVQGAQGCVYAKIGKGSTAHTHPLLLLPRSCCRGSCSRQMQ